MDCKSGTSCAVEALFTIMVARRQDLAWVNQEGLGVFKNGFEWLFVPSIFAVESSVMLLVFWNALGCFDVRNIARCETSENPIDVSVRILLIEVACLVTCLGHVKCNPSADSINYPSLLILFTKPSARLLDISPFQLTW